MVAAVSRVQDVPYGEIVATVSLRRRVPAPARTSTNYPHHRRRGGTGGRRQEG